MKPDFPSIVKAYLLHEEEMKWHERRDALIGICDRAFAAGEVSRSEELIRRTSQRAMLDDGSWWAEP